MASPETNLDLDIKAANILFLKQDSVVTDFGIALSSRHPTSPVGCEA